MKEETAVAIADLVLLAAAGAAAWLILRDPRLRRPALRLVRTLVTGTIPAYLAREVRTAWVASGQQNHSGMMAG
jgi:hypothetical protein